MKVLQLLVGVILIFLVLLLVAMSGLTIYQWQLLGNEKYFALILPLLFSLLFGRYGFYLIRKGLGNQNEKPGTLDEDQLID